MNGRTSLADIILLLIGAGIAYYAYVYLPHYYNKFIMDDLAIETLKVWKETDSQAKALRHLRIEIEDREIAFYITPKTCQLETHGAERHIQCEWRALIQDSLRDQESIKIFSLHKYLNADGILEDVE